MIYRILRRLARIAFAIYFRRIYILDRQHLPKSGPVLLACNHPSAFMEAAVLSAWSRRALHYLTRGDFFEIPWLKGLLYATHQIPIYRSRDGFGNLRSNIDTFQACFERLARGKVIMIFPEARTILEKRLRPVQKGAARIAFGAMEGDIGLIPAVVPVGVTFTNPRKLGGVAYFQYGTVIDYRDLLGLYEDRPQEAIRILTERLEQSMKDLIVHIDDPAREEIFDQVWELAVEEREIFPKVSEDVTTFNRLRSLARQLNEMPEDELRKLSRIIEVHGPDLMLATHLAREPVAPGMTGMVIFLLGRLFNLVPVSLTGRIVTMVKAETFQGPVKAISGFLIHGVYYFLITLALTWLGGWIGLIAGIFLLMTGYYAYTQSWTSRLYGSLPYRLSSTQKRNALDKALQEVRNLLEIHA